MWKNLLMVKWIMIHWEAMISKRKKTIGVDTRNLYSALMKIINLQDLVRVHFIWQLSKDFNYLKIDPNQWGQTASSQSQKMSQKFMP